MGAELFHVVGQTDIMMLIVAAPKNSTFGLFCIYVFCTCLGTNRDARPI